MNELLLTVLLFFVLSSPFWFGLMLMFHLKYRTNKALEDAERKYTEILIKRWERQGRPYPTRARNQLDSDYQALLNAWRVHYGVTGEWVDPNIRYMPKVQPDRPDESITPHTIK